MIRRLATNPAVIVLAALVILSVFALGWSLDTLIDPQQQNMSWSGEPSAEQFWQLRLSRIASTLPPLATITAVVSALGILAIASASRALSGRRAR